MKYFMILMMSLGLYTFSTAQDNSSKLDEDCPPSSKSGQTESKLEKSSSDMNEEDATSKNTESDNNYRYEYYEQGSEGQSQNMDTSRMDQSQQDQSMQSKTSVSVNADSSTNQVTTVTKTRKEDGTLENIVEAPFKVVIHTVGEVGEGVGHIGKGVGEGAAHIVVAPVKAVGRLFGWGTKHKYEENVTSTTTTTKSAPDVNVDVNTESNM